MHDEHHHTELPSLLDDLGETGAPFAPNRRAGPLAGVKSFFADVLRADVRVTKRASMLAGVGIASLGVLVGGAFAWSAFRPIHPPNAAKDSLGSVLNFALLDADFSRLSVEERMKLVLELAARMRSMSGSDSALVAAFAAGISGKAREQLETNARTLAMDLMASYGEKYARAPEDQKEKFIEQAAVEFSKLTEQLTGQERNITDAERLTEMKTQAKKDAERGRKTDKGLKSENVSGLFKMVQNDLNKYSSPNQRAGTQRFVRDMTRTLRGRDPVTNQPKKD